MKTYGDVEHVNLATGQRYRRVVGNGESCLRLYDDPTAGLAVKYHLLPAELRKTLTFEDFLSVARILGV